MSSLTSNNCGCGCNNGTSLFSGGNSCMWIILLLLFCGGNGGCGCNNGCGTSLFNNNGNSSCDWLIWILILSSLSNNNGCGCNEGCGCGNNSCNSCGC